MQLETQKQPEVIFERPSETRPVRHCPSCGAAADRVPRTRVDRVLSHVSANQRYECTLRTCGWKGRMHVPDNTGPSNFGRYVIITLLVAVAVAFGVISAVSSDTAGASSNTWW